MLQEHQNWGKLNLAFLWSNWQQVVRLQVFYEKPRTKRGQMDRSLSALGSVSLTDRVVSGGQQLSLKMIRRLASSLTSIVWLGVNIPQVLQLLSSSLKNQFTK